MTTKDRQQIRLYFERSIRAFPQWTVTLVTAGIVIAVMAESFVVRLLGVAAIALAGTVDIRKLMASPYESQMDAWLKEDLDGLILRALTKSNLDVSELVRGEVLVIAPCFHKSSGVEFGFRRGGDGRVRFTPVNVTLINFTEHQLVLYNCLLDLMTGKPLNEGVDEYFYNDVISVASRSESLTYSVTELDKRLLSRIPGVARSSINGEIFVNGAETFILSNSGGTQMRVVLNVPVFVQALGGGELPLGWAEQAIQAIRKMLREKKAGALPIRDAGI